MKFKLNNIKFFLLLFPFVEPLIFKEPGYELIDRLYTILKLLTFGFIIINYLLYKKKITNNKVSIYTFLVILLELLIGFSTLYSNGEISRYFGPAISIIAFVLLTEIYFFELKLDFIKIVYFYLFILMIINIISILIWPTGIFVNKGGNSVYFLGIDNRFVFFYIPLIYFSIVYSLKKYNKLNFFVYLTIFLCLGSTIYLWSVGAFLGLFIIFFSVLLQNKFKLIRKVKMKYFIIAIIIINILVVFFQIQNHFEDFIINVLKKDLTFTGRTYIWKNSLSLIKIHPIIGFGIQPIVLLQSYYYGVAHTHNMFLNYLTISGCIGLILYLFILFYISKKSNLIKDERVRILSCFVVFTILFLSIGDTLDAGIFFMIYACIYYYTEVLEK